MFLNRAVKLKDAKFTDLVECMAKKLKAKDLSEVFSEVKNLWNDSDNHRQLPDQFYVDT